MNIPKFMALTLVMAIICFTCSSAYSVTSIDYTDHTEVYSCDKYCQKGDIYTMRFTPQSDAKIIKVQFQSEGEGTVEIHLWPDSGGLPNMEWDLITPVEVNTEETRKYYMAEIEDENLHIDRLLEFHVGLVRMTKEGAKLCMDATKDYAFRAKYRKDGEWIENERDWFVRVYVEYENEPTEFYFSDVTQSAGLDSLGGRMAWGDYDNDGDQDLLMSGSILYKNNGDGTFSDVSDAAGVSGLGSNGGLWADFNNDGALDFFAMVNSLTENDKFMQSNGDGTFTDITATALLPGDFDYWPTEGAAWGDYDKDGYIDLYLANYEMPGEELANGTPDKLYHNNGDGTFTDVAESLDIDPGDTTEDRRCGRGVNWGDFNDDGWPDIYVSNYRLDPNFLYMNNGDGTFTEVAEEKGVKGYQSQGAWGHTIGSAWGDFNNDGYLDLFNANLAHPRFAAFSDQSLLFINNGPPDYDFTDYTETAQVIFIETNSEPCLGDWNNDGWLDVLVTNVYENFWQQLYRNDGDATLTDVTYFSGLNIENGWGGTFVDYNQDGYPDVVSNKGLWKNNGNDNQWIKVNLECNTGDPFCIGARVELQLVSDGPVQAKEVASGKGTTNSPPFILHFGLNQCQSAWRITAKFLNGKVVTLYEKASGQTVTINEDDVSDTEPVATFTKASCADVDYSGPQWPDPAADDDDDDDDDDNDSSDDDDSGSDDDDDDDQGCGC